MSDFNRELHHEDHHDVIAVFKARIQELEAEREAALDVASENAMRIKELEAALERIIGLGDYWGNEGWGLGQYLRDVEETARQALQGGQDEH